MSVLSFSYLWLLLFPFSPGLPPYLAGRALVLAATAVTASSGAAVAPLGDRDVVLLALEEGVGQEATGEVVACRSRGEWREPLHCPLGALPERELRVFRGAVGEVGRWTVAESAPRIDGGRVFVEGTFSAPLPPVPSLPDGMEYGEALYASFALLGGVEAAVVVPVGHEGERAALAGMLDHGRRAARMSVRMAHGLVPTQALRAALVPGENAAILAGSSHPTGDLAAAGLPSASLLLVHGAAAVEGGEPWSRAIVAQVISNPNDLRQFERYRVATLLDLDGDDRPALVVRATSAGGDRFRLFRMRDDNMVEAVSPWAGFVQPLSAPSR